jgi:hypothetical protein
MPRGCYFACIEHVNLQRASNNCTVKIGPHLCLLSLITLLNVADSKFVLDAILRGSSLFSTIMLLHALSLSTNFSSLRLAYLKCNQLIIFRNKLGALK